MQMASQMKATGAGVVVISCSDPRLNPYQILGIDPTLSEYLSYDIVPIRGYMAFVKRLAVVSFANK
jgi:hypothetical protein